MRICGKLGFGCALTEVLLLVVLKFDLSVDRKTKIKKIKFKRIKFFVRGNNRLRKTCGRVKIRLRQSGDFFMLKNCGENFYVAGAAFKNEKYSEFSRDCDGYVICEKKIFKREQVLCAVCAFLLAILAVAVCYKNASAPFFARDYKEWGGARYDVYLYTQSSGCKVLSYFSLDEVCAGKAKNAENVKGECAFFTQKLSEEQINAFAKELNADLVFKECGENFKNYYFYSPRLPSFVVIGGEKVNVHAAVAESGTALAYPLAFGAY